METIYSTRRNISILTVQYWFSGVSSFRRSPCFVTNIASLHGSSFSASKTVCNKERLRSLLSSSLDLKMLKTTIT